ncbi:MAG: hypothetical protein ACRDRH_04625 [Pseudonocardia sp.]
MNSAARGRSIQDRSCIAEAITVVAAQPGGVERILATHRRRSDGRCTGCAHTLTKWPCTVAGIALGARDHARYRPVPG